MAVQQLLPAAGVTRVETGAVAFGSDWPGLFIRGDDALALALDIRVLIRFTVGERPSVEALGASLGGLTRLAQLIETEVCVK